MQRQDNFRVPQFMRYIMTETSPPPSSRRFSPTPVETTVKKVRRFAVEPVETTTRSNKKDESQVEDESTVEKKDFAPAKRRFLSEPVETTFKSSRQVANLLPTPEPTPVSIPKASPPEETPKPRRRFVPELIETTKRSKRAGDPRPATLPTDKVCDLILHILLNCTDHDSHYRPTSLPECQISIHVKNERSGLPSHLSHQKIPPLQALLLFRPFHHYLLVGSPQCGPIRTQEEVQGRIPSNPS